MPERRDFAVYSIPSHRPFADSLVSGILSLFGHDQRGLADGLILVPNNRARAAIVEAFVRKSEKGLLLPRIVTIGDPELNERSGGALEPLTEVDVPPAIDPQLREMLLAQLLVDKKLAPDIGVAGVFKLASDLGGVLDALSIEGKSHGDIASLVPENLSKHWETAFLILNYVLLEWPHICKARGVIDLTDRRNLLMDAQAERWRKTPPKGFVVAAGISMVAPHAAALLRTISQLPNGHVVLAGLDTNLEEDEWDSLLGERHPVETHPQYHLRLLLERMRVPKALVMDWPGKEGASKTQLRANAISAAMAPAAFTTGWAERPENLRNFTNASALTLPTMAEEAQVIALALRHAIEQPNIRAALITPDRTLANRVSTLLKRWGIRADDSAGQPLSSLPAGTILQALADAAESQFAPVELLALLKHPLVRAGGQRLAWLDGVRQLDLLLRGPRPEPGLAGISNLVKAKGKADAVKWWEEANALLRGYEAETGKSNSLSVHIAALREVATQLCGEAIWSGPAGRSAAECVSSLEENASAFKSTLSPADFARFLHMQMQKIAVRSPEGGHPRIAIWGLLEAKLQSVDFAILGGLNEEVWPQGYKPDPWLAPSIVRELQMPGPEYRIGVSAHDLVSAFSASDILLTRSERDDSGPSKASRFWLRLETLARGFNRPATPYDVIAKALDFAEENRTKRPKFAPPVEDRPRKISVTDVDRLRSDPFAYYAKSMLQLSKLDSPGEDPDAAWMGTFVHAVMQRWGEKGYAPDMLAPMITGAFQSSAIGPVERALRLPQFEAAALYLAEQIAENRRSGRKPVAEEVSGEIKRNGVVLHGKADRLDAMADGNFSVVDYKTGSVPKQKQIDGGYAMQLGLLAAIGQAEGFKGVKGKPNALEYWSFGRPTRSKDYGFVKSGVKKGSQATEIAHNALESFDALAAHYLLNETVFEAKLKPEYAWPEYDHLMRYEEWRGRDV